MKAGKSSQVWLLIFSMIFTLAYSPIFTTFDKPAGAQVAESFDTEGAPVTVYDPHERFNRAMFDINDKIYFFVLKPASTVYAAYFPPGFRAAIRNGFYNLFFPIRFINCLLQGKANLAGTEAARFVINSTMGLGGLFDWAERGFGLQRHSEDFGQTLAVWGAGSGAYLVLPILGPTNSRDLVGYVVDSAMDPIYWIPSPLWASPSIVTGKLVNNTSLRLGEYEDFKKTALDPYISLRTAYYQYRIKEIAK